MKNISISIDEQSLKKLKVIALNESRTLSGQIRTVIRRFLEKYEAENGTIKVNNY